VRPGLPSTSRYAAVTTAVLVRRDGSEVAYLRRRFVPDPARFETLIEHPVAEGERLDNLSYAYLDDPEQFWRLCDANRALRPAELTDELGEIVRITLPEGVAGPRDA
jgi:hypothetical protein